MFPTAQPGILKSKSKPRARFIQPQILNHCSGRSWNYDARGNMLMVGQLLLKLCNRYKTTTINDLEHTTSCTVLKMLTPLNMFLTSLQCMRCA